MSLHKNATLKRKFLTFTENIPAVFHNLNQKISQARFYNNTVSLHELTKCHWLNSALRLTLTKTTNKKKQTKGRTETKQKYEKEKQKHGFLPKWKDDFNWLANAC